MSSNSFHNFINLDVIHYLIWLKRRITTINDKIYVIEFSHFIKFFFYLIQNRDNTFFFKQRVFASISWMNAFFSKEFDKNKFKEFSKRIRQKIVQNIEKKKSSFTKKFSLMKKRNIKILKTIEWSIDFVLLNLYFFENCNILTKTRFLKILFWFERMFAF